MARVMHLRPPELAERLRLSTSTLAHWRVSGEGPRFIKHGRVVLYPEPEVEAWEKSRLRSAVHVAAAS